MDCSPFSLEYSILDSFNCIWEWAMSLLAVTSCCIGYFALYFLFLIFYNLLLLMVLSYSIRVSICLLVYICYIDWNMVSYTKSFLLLSVYIVFGFREPSRVAPQLHGTWVAPAISREKFKCRNLVSSVKKEWNKQKGGMESKSYVGIFHKIDEEKYFH